MDKIERKTVGSPAEMTKLQEEVYQQTWNKFYKYNMESLEDEQLKAFTSLLGYKQIIKNQYNDEDVRFDSFYIERQSELSAINDLIHHQLHRSNELY